MCRLISTLLLCTQLSIASTSLYGEDTPLPVLEYGYPDVSVWTTQRDATGQLKNPLLRLAEAMFHAAGISWTGKAYPAKRLFKHLNDGLIPFSMLVRASSLDECCLFSETPVAHTELRVYRLRSSPPVTRPGDLIGKRVILIRGYSYGSLGRYMRDEENHIEIQEAAGHASAFQLFERRRGDYIIDYTGPAEEVLSVHPIENLTSDVIRRLDVFLVVSRKYPDAHELMRRLEVIVSSLNTAEILSPD